MLHSVVRLHFDMNNTALKLEFSPFAVEDMIADCMELLLPMAAKKLDLSFNIEPDVPACVYRYFSAIGDLLTFNVGVKADYARIRQGD